MGAQQEGCVTPRRPVRHAHARREHAEEAQPTGLVTPRHSARQRQSTTRRLRHAQALRAAKAAHNPRGASRPGTQRGERSAQPKGCVTRRHSVRRRQRTTRGVRHAQALSAAKAAHNPRGASCPGTPRAERSAQPKGCVPRRHSARQRQRTTRRVRHALALRAAQAAHNPNGCVTPRHSARRTQRTTRRVRHAWALSAAKAAHNPEGASRPGTPRGERSAQPKGCVTRGHSARQRQRTTRGVRHAQAHRAANAAHNPKGASRAGTPRGKGGAQPKGCVTSRLSARRRQRTTRRVRHAEALVSVPHDLQGGCVAQRGTLREHSPGACVTSG